MSLQVKIRRRGIDLNVLPGKIRDVVVPGFVSAVADFAFERMYANAPWRSGFLAMSITKEVRKEGFTVKPTAKYAVYVEKGTSPHVIRPLSASCLAFQAGSGLVFTRLVRHPGTKANPFVAWAAAETKENLGKVFEDVWKREVGKS